MAYVYIGTDKGVNLYDADVNGKLTLVKGSPFQVIGSIWGSNRKHFITLGTYWVHSYPVAANGGIGKQVSTVDTQSYLGADCGSTDNSILDHTGQNIYVFVNMGGDGCAAYQSYNINKSTGALTFNDAVLHNNGGPWHVNPTFTADDKFAYALEAWQYGDKPEMVAFTRDNNGGLQMLNFTETDPTPQARWQYWPSTMTEDPTNHLAMGVVPYDFMNGTGGPIQLASYTVDAAGNITSTNTWENMPTPDVSPSTMNMSPSGKLLAIGGNQGDYVYGPSPNGLEVFHFNGANPITPYSAAERVNDFETGDARV